MSLRLQDDERDALEAVLICIASGIGVPRTEMTPEQAEAILAWLEVKGDS